MSAISLPLFPAEACCVILSFFHSVLAWSRFLPLSCPELPANGSQRAVSFPGDFDSLEFALFRQKLPVDWSFRIFCHIYPRPIPCFGLARRHARAPGRIDPR